MPSGLPDDFASIYAAVEEAARRHASPGRTLDVPALVHEVYLRLHTNGGPWESKAHLLAAACMAARQYAANYARNRARQKRGGGEAHFSLNEEFVGSAPLDVAALLDAERALSAFERVDPARARVVVLRAYGGLTVEETAETLSVSTATVKRSYAAALSWLALFLSDPIGLSDPASAATG